MSGCWAGDQSVLVQHQANRRRRVNSRVEPLPVTNQSISKITVIISRRKSTNWCFKDLMIEIGNGFQKYDQPLPEVCVLTFHQ